jgi:REP element-mobilizing transposase RayT
MIDKTIFYKRNLPHIHPEDGTFFITFRLADSLPIKVLQEIKNQKENEIKLVLKKFNSKEEIEKEKYKIERRYFGKLDNLLDNPSEGPRWLENEKIAKIVIEKIHNLDGIRYKLIAYCIMCNHVHLLIDTTGFNKSSETNICGKTKDYPLADTMRLLKGGTARLCNIELCHKGSFWYEESYDHYVRDEKEFYRIIKYILNNPVKAGLVKNWKEWKFSYWVEEL